MNGTAKRKDLMVVNMGPHHPSIHGFLRLIVTLDGEDVIDCEPLLGYLHRGMEKIAEFLFLQNFEPMRQMLFLFQRRLGTKTGLENPYYTEEETKESKEEDKRTKKEQEEKRRIAIGEAWDSFIVAQVIRGSLLITQSILRKYIVLPSLIIIKNIVRMLLFQFPEWSEDFRDWNREIYIKCTYNGVQLSETEFSKWLLDGIQIQIRFSFHLKPWHRSKLRSTKKDPMKKKGTLAF